jgi:predicted metal-dependent hydrolase
MAAARFEDRSPRLLDLGDEIVSVRVRESQRARTLRVIVGPRRPLEAIVPRGLGDRALDRFLAEKRGWIAKKLADSRAIADRAPQLGLGRRGVVWLDLEPIEVVAIETTAFDGGPLHARLEAGQLVVGNLSFSRGTDAAIAAIERWYRRQARSAIGEAVEREAARLRLRFGSLAIRDQRTRWGSCSRRGNLSFSWRLVIAPREVLDYVVVHELCHLREPNHSKAFWRVLEAARLGWQEHSRWLREHGHELHDYSVSAALESGG